MSALDHLVGSLRSHYDKLIAFALLLGLIFSLFYLAVQVGRIQTMQAEWDQRISRLKPLHPEAEPQDESAFQEAQKAIHQPFQIEYSAWGARQLMVPEVRVSCVDCLWPIPLAATNCPFCGVAQPTYIPRDSDHDGMLDDWEKRYGLNPMDPGDGHQDADGDGFTNQDEHGAGKDPTDPRSRPDLPYKLGVEKIVRKEFRLKFRSTIMGPDGFRVYGLNLAQGSSVQTFFRKIGQDVAGFRLVRFEEKFTLKSLPGSRRPYRADVSELTLVQGDKVIVLVKDEDKAEFEYSASIFFAVDKIQFLVKKGDVFSLRNERYRVLRIDTDSETVVIERELDGKPFTIKPLPK